MLETSIVSGVIKQINYLFKSLKSLFVLRAGEKLCHCTFHHLKPKVETCLKDMRWKISFHTDPLAHGWAKRTKSRKTGWCDFCNCNWLCFVAAENCSGYRTCGQCLDQPGCGWCTDPSNTGKGQCIEGSYRGPFQTSVPAPSTLPGLPASPQPALNVSMCPNEAKYNWSFIHCPGERGWKGSGGAACVDVDVCSHTRTRSFHTWKDTLFYFFPSLNQTKPFLFSVVRDYQKNVSLLCAFANPDLSLWILQ